VIILGIDFVNNIEWWQRQLKLGEWSNSIKETSTALFGSFKIGYELLIYNGLLTFLGLFIISREQPVSKEVKKILEHGNY
jgi:hypothetical protein